MKPHPVDAHREIVAEMASTWRRLYVHLVWGTKHRLPVIDASREALIGGMCRDKAFKQSCEVLAFGAVEDHVHLLVSMHTTASVAKLVRAMKRATSLEIARIDPRDPPFAWQSGYAVLSVDPREAAVLCGYVERQKAHHAEGNTLGNWEPPLAALDDDPEYTAAPERSEAAPAKSRGRRRG